MSENVARYLEARHRTNHQAATSGDYQHWRLYKDDSQVLWVLFDKADTDTNTLNADVLIELDKILDHIKQNRPKGVVLRSLKRNGFCAGADINQFSELGEDEAVSMLRRGHAVLDRLENLDIPTLALVHGHCLGGGLELALACDQRLGVKGGLQMGFPEIQLGLHPGLGGTFRLTRLLSPISAMTMMLTGRPAHEGQCKQRGLVNTLVADRHVEAAAGDLIGQKAHKKRSTFGHYLMNIKPARQLASKRMRSEAAKKAPPQHYPAPNALIDLWLQHGGNVHKMQTAEIKSFARLLESDTSKNLVRVFFLRQALKDQASGDSDVKHVHVIGAGAMGGDIAGWCALQGCQVTLSDARLEPIGQALKITRKLCRSKHKSPAETRAILDRLLPDPDGVGIAKADLIIEAVPEELELKQKIYRDIEPRLKDGAILATNTSSIPLEELAATLKDPSRLVGIHFFNPVARMMVVEVVSHGAINETVFKRAVNFTDAIGKLPVAVKSYPGFLVNRALTPYLMEAIVLLDEGVDKETIDRAATDFGMPMGPVELADQVGLDICLHVAKVLKGSLTKPMPEVPGWLEEKVQAGELGKKSGRGFYHWKKGRAQKSKTTESTSMTREELQDRLILPLLNACVECHREGVVADLDQLDGAMIFATGFAPFTGGPMHYAQARGVSVVRQRLTELAEAHGERFAPDAGWDDL